MAAAKWPYFLAVVLLVLGVVLIIVGGCLVKVFNDVISDRLKSNERPLNGSESFEAWKNWSHYQPIYRHFHFFDIVNPQQVIDSGKNVTVRETGPYVYRVNFERRNVRFNEKNSLLSYDVYKSYTFEKDLSNGDENDELTVLNLPILNLATRLRLENRTVQTVAAREIARLDEGLFTRVPVSDILWGYTNQNLLHLLQFLDGYFHIQPLNDTTYGLLHQTDQPKRTTYEGSYTVEIDDLDSLWKVKEWNGKSSLNAWNSESANRIDGTEGFAWPPGLTRSSSSVSLFDSEWCRSIRLTGFDQEKDSSQTENLTTYGYHISNTTFSYSADENKGFCQPTPTQNESCLEDGVLNNTKCKDNAPLLLSQPHFLGASPNFSDVIIGLRPNRSKHETTFNIEPVSGEIVETSRKMQLNAYVMKLTSFPNTTHFENGNTVVPVVWMNEIYSMTETERKHLADESKKIQELRRKYDAIQYTLIGLGALLILIAILLLIVAFLLRRRRENPENEVNQPDETQPLLR